MRTEPTHCPVTRFDHDQVVTVLARDFSGTLVSKLFEPEPNLRCIGQGHCCDWVSQGGRCQRTLAPNYSSLAKGKMACSAFMLGGRTLEELERAATVIAVRRNG